MKNLVKKLYDSVIDMIIEKAYEFVLEKMKEKGYDESNIIVSTEAPYITIKVKPEERTGMKVDWSGKPFENYLEDVVEYEVKQAAYTYDDDYEDIEGQVNPFDLGRLTGGGTPIYPGKFCSIDTITDWVRNTKAPNDPVLMAVLDADEFEYAIDRTAYRVARKIYYVGRKPSGMTPEQWDDDTAGMRPVEGTYSPTTEHWTNGFPYGPDYEYRTGMFE